MQTTYIIIGLLIFVIGLIEYRTKLFQSLIEGKIYEIMGNRKRQKPLKSTYGGKKGGIRNWWVWKLLKITRK